ncbi:hypothetical protein Hamer_G018116, partial [Homarus americanus]
MYLDDWLISASSKEEGESSTRVTLVTVEGMGFRINHPKSSLSPSQLVWLGMEWDTFTASLRLSQTTHDEYFGASLSPQWSSASPPPYQGGQCGHPGRTQGSRTSHAPSLSTLLRPSLPPDALRRWTLWFPPAPTLFVVLDASDVGWGYQSSKGYHQVGGWTDEWRAVNINVRELYMAWRFLEDNQTAQDEAICLEMNSTAADFLPQQAGHGLLSPIAVTLGADLQGDTPPTPSRRTGTEGPTSTCSQPLASRFGYGLPQASQFQGEGPPPGPLLAGSTIVLKATRLVSASADVGEHLPL